MDSEVTGASGLEGCTELRTMIFSDSVSVTRFSKPVDVELKVEDSYRIVPVDFIYNMRQRDRINPIGWQGAGFLGRGLKYTGFSKYDTEKVRIYVNQEDFAGIEVLDTQTLKRKLRDYYGDDFEEFQRAIESLPADVRDITKALLL